MAKRTRRDFSPQFKKKTVERVTRGGESVKGVVQQLKIAPSMWHRWARDVRQESQQDGAVSVADRPAPVKQAAEKKSAGRRRPAGPVGELAVLNERRAVSRVRPAEGGGGVDNIEIINLYTALGRVMAENEGLRRRLELAER